MISKNKLPLWFIFIQLYPAMKGLSNKTLISSQFKAVSESNPLASSVFFDTVIISGKCLEHNKPSCCFAAEASHEIYMPSTQYVKDKAAENGVHMN